MENTPRQTRAKRKQPPVTNGESRTVKKQRRPSIIEATVPDEAKPRQNAHANGTDVSDEEGSIINAALTVRETREWQATIERVVKNVVSIHFCQTASFDTDPALSSEATGFVVDAERGYILTNRHVVGAGPFWGYCIFDNHEECDVWPVYRDPVHDFGFLRFDPKAIKYMPVESLALRPDLAKIGAEIRVVGNDAGEKLSILSGVISRLDRNAPEYGEGFSDFNTNYIQAAASASGGSSGSPVVQIDGHAVALQAGGRSDGAATDYFLPLDRPLRALQCLQQQEPITRGTIQVQWLLKTFDECRRLGLRADSEAAVRACFPSDNNMLVAEVVLPGGPSHKVLEEGDILLKVNNQLLTQFIKLDAILDSSVGQTVKLTVQRGGEDLEIKVGVSDLHAITPDRYVTVAGASFHDLSYQQARLYAVECKGVFVCEASGSFRFDGLDYGWLITSIDNTETPDLETFTKVMEKIPDRSRVVGTYKHLRDLHTHNTSVILIDRHWAAKMRLAVRNDITGLWDFTDLAKPLPPPEPEPRSANFIEMKGVKDPRAADIIRSFVRVHCNMPIKIEGYPRSRRVGFGLIVDADKGLVVVSRAFIPYDLCDVSVTIADSIIVDATVLFMHPIQNYVIIQYNPSLVRAPVKSAPLSTRNIKQGEQTILFGFNQNYRPVIAKTAVTDVTSVAIPASASTPRWRSINLDAITVDSGLSSQVGTGVLVSEEGEVQALWLTYLGEHNAHSRDVEYNLGMATPLLLPIIQQVQAGITPQLRILNIECNITTMAQARIMGLTEEWIQRVEREDPERHQLFMVRKVDCGHAESGGGLKEGDLILTLDGKLVTRTADLDVMYNKEVLDALILRKREQLELQVRTIPTEDLNTDRAVLFCGAILHRPHHAVRQQISKMHSQVYISGRVPGSPASMYGLAPTNFITAVNAVETPDLTAFLNEVNKIPDNTYFRLKVRTFDDVPWVATMKKNEHYFPTMEFVKDDPRGNGERRWRMLTYDANGRRREGGEPFEGTQVDLGDAGASSAVE